MLRSSTPRTTGVNEPAGLPRSSNRSTTRRPRPGRSATDLAADRDAAVAILHATAAHDDVLRWCRQPPSVRVTSALDRNAVITSIELAVFTGETSAPGSRPRGKRWGT